MKLYTPNCEVTEEMAVPEATLRVALVVEYNGARYKGFQKQASTTETVQEHLQRALSFVADQNITVVCAGRTDAGVHAVAQTVHFDTSAKRSDKAWLQGTNTKLPPGIRVSFAQHVPFAFHARFSALARTYRYVMRSSAVRPAIMEEFVTWTPASLDVAKMQREAQGLLGEHDFSSFRSSQCQAHSPWRNMQRIDIHHQGAFVVFELKANAFLHHMVRNLVGAFLEAGKAQTPAGYLTELMALRDRTKAPPTALPNGLYLAEVQYPDGLALAYKPSGPLFLEV